MDADRQKLLDTRVVARNIKAGLIPAEEYESHLAALEDCAELALPTETMMVFNAAKEEDLEEPPPAKA